MNGSMAQTGTPARTRRARPAVQGWLERRTRAARAAVVIGGLAIVPALFYGAVLVLTAHDLGFDLRYAYLPASHDVLRGLSPYVGATSHSLGDQTAYVYPPLLAFLVSPLTILAPTVAAVVGAAAFLLAVLAMLFLLGVRDWRCYGIVLLWAPVFDAVDNVNVSLLVAFCLALTWRYRDRAIVAGLALGVGIALKVFAWPLLVWALAARRARMGLVAFAVATAAVFLPWAALGFAGLSGYPGLLRQLSTYEQDRSYSLHALLTGAGLSSAVATGAAIVLSAFLLGVVVLLARRGAELSALTVAIATALAVSPVVWQHYLVLLVVPLAVARPTLSVVWFLPLLLWASDLRGNNGALWQTVLVPGVAAVLVLVCCRTASRPMPDRQFRRLGGAAL